MLTLYSHPSTPIPWVQSVQANATMVDEEVDLVYLIVGDIQFLRIPIPRSTQRMDGLWEHTCCELFVAERTKPNYQEWNFSPSGQWQRYEFCGYRKGRVQPDILTPPIIIYTLMQGGLIVEVKVPLASFSPKPDLCLGFTMVLEDQHGGLYYLALKHCAERPDFHCADSWIGRL